MPEEDKQEFKKVLPCSGNSVLLHGKLRIQLLLGFFDYRRLVIQDTLTMTVEGLEVNPEAKRHGVAWLTEEEHRHRNDTLSWWCNAKYYDDRGRTANVMLEIEFLWAFPSFATRCAELYDIFVIQPNIRMTNGNVDELTEDAVVAILTKMDQQVKK